MAKIKLHGMFARVRGKFNKSESLYFKGCPCKKEQLGVDLINPSKATHPKNVQCQPRKPLRLPWQTPPNVLPSKPALQPRRSTPPSSPTPSHKST